eukprot:gene11551-56523_t
MLQAGTNSCASVSGCSICSGECRPATCTDQSGWNAGQFQMTCDAAARCEDTGSCFDWQGANFDCKNTATGGGLNPALWGDPRRVGEGGRRASPAALQPGTAATGRSVGTPLTGEPGRVRDAAADSTPTTAADTAERRHQKKKEKQKARAHRKKKEKQVKKKAAAAAERRRALDALSAEEDAAA